MIEPTEHPPEVIDRTTRELDVILSPEELAKIGRALARAIEDVEQEEADQAEQKAAMKQRLADMQASQRRLATSLRRGVEKRLIDVEILADWINGTAIERRCDTGEILTTRPLREDEKQMRLTPEVAAAADGAVVVHGDA